MKVYKAGALNDDEDVVLVSDLKKNLKRVDLLIDVTIKDTESNLKTLRDELNG